MSHDVREVLSSFGIQGFYILDSDAGTSLVELIFNDDVYKIGSGQLVGGFLSALAGFLKDEFSGVMSDMGLMHSRMYIDYTPGLIFILLFDEIKLQKLPIEILHTLLKSVVSSVKTMFLDLIEELSAGNVTGCIKHTDTPFVLKSHEKTISEYILTSYRDGLEMFSTPSLLSSILQSKVCENPKCKLNRLLSEEKQKHFRGMIDEAIHELYEETI